MYYVSFHPVTPGVRLHELHRRKVRRLVRLTVLVVATLSLFSFGLEIAYSAHHSSDVSTLTPKPPTGDSSPVSSGVSVPSSGNNLVNAWEGALNNQPGDVAIAVYDNNTKQTFHYETTEQTFNTASIVKVALLEDVLLKNQQQGIPTLTNSQLSLVTPMIEYSNDDSATQLWEQLGGTKGLNDFFTTTGMTNSAAGASDLWGLTQTTALDQVALMNHIAYPGTFLSASSAQQADNLLDNVVSTQSWGVSAGSPNDVTVELKDGWLPDNQTDDPYSDGNGWIMNSIGHIHGEGQDYTIAVLTMGDPTQTQGISTIENLAGITWRTLSGQSNS